MRLDIRIGPRDVNFLGFLTLKSLFDSLIDAATNDANRLGFGISELHKRGFSWVISGIAVEIKRMPKTREIISVETWIEKSNRIYSYRHFKIYDGEGNIIIKATSTWSAISIKERKLANITQLIDCKASSNGIGIDIEPVERIWEIEPASTTCHRVVYSDIDINGHANSSRYIEWICDSLDNVFERINSVSRFEISYLQEVRYGENVSILSQNESEKGREIFVLRSDDDQIVCSAIFSFSISL